MTWTGSRCLVAWVLAGDALLSVLPSREWGSPLLKASFRDIAAVRTLFLVNAEVLKGSNPPPPATADVSSSPRRPTTAAVTDKANGKDTAAYVAHGQRLQLEGSLHEAAAVLEDVLASNENEPTALLHLAGVYQELGESRRATAAADRLLHVDQLNVEARSFVLNLRGIILKSAGDLGGARESYELALQDGQDNRHASYNLALLLHYSVFPESLPDPPVQILEQAIGLYRAALGRGNASPALPSLSTQLGADAREHIVRRNDGIGGPVDRASVSRDLASALSQAGRPAEAVAELEQALSLPWGVDDSGKIHPSEGDLRAAAGGGGGGKDAAMLWDSLAGAKLAVGDVFGAVDAARTAVKLTTDEPILYHNMGCKLQKAGLLAEAREAWLSALSLDPRLSPALASLGHLEGAEGNIGRAREFYEASLAALTPKDTGDGGSRTYANVADSSGDAVLTSMFLIATAVVPTIYNSNDHIDQIRRDFGRGLDWLLSEPTGSSLMRVEAPLTTVGSGSLGYYIIYQGFEDLGIRRKLAHAYWKYAPSLRYCAQFLRNGIAKEDCRQVSGCAEEAGASTLEAAKSVTLPGPHERITPQKEKKESRDSHSETPAELTTEGVPFAKEDDVVSSGVGKECHLPCGRRLRVGFLSGFFCHHSVGLLVEGVVTRLDRRRFETTAIFLQPHPARAFSGGTGEFNSTSGGSNGGGDDVYETVRRKTEHVLDMPVDSLAGCRQAIASLQLDVLVFTEIGMNFESYFLSFARLARRSAMFWGHAVTSGVSAFDGMSVRNSDDLGTAGSTARAIEPHEVGGIDYFVSSWLFEDNNLGRLAQRKYSERLYLMKGLTTRFARPPPPKPGLVTREILGIPPHPLSPLGSARLAFGLNTGVASTSSRNGLAEELANGSLSCEALYLVPQTLYKLHPDFDTLVAGVLKADVSGCVVFIRAFEAATTEALVGRMSKTLLAAGVGFERVVFIRRVGLDEFAALAEMVDVVLDPFPVGGGRSSLEVFAVGTPIVMLYNRTSILQLTYGMYATMGLAGPIADVNVVSAPVALVTYSEDQFIHSAVTIATYSELNARLKERILANNHRLYEQDEVISEWEDFLEAIVSSPRPPTVERHSLAVDASDFPRQPRWCSQPEGRTANARAAQDHPNTTNSLQSNKGRGSGGGGGGSDGGGGSGGGQNDTCSTHTLQNARDIDECRSQRDADGPQHAPGAPARNESIKSVLDGKPTTIVADDDDGASRSIEAVGKVVPKGGGAGVGFGSGHFTDVVTGPKDGSEESHGMSTSLASLGRSAVIRQPGDAEVAAPVASLGRSSVIRQPGDAEVAAPLAPIGKSSATRQSDNAEIAAAAAADDSAEHKPELLYTVEFSAAPAREGDKNVRLLAEVFEGSDPMAVAAKLMQEGALDYLQYRWIGAILCRGVGRLKRPVVWSHRVRIDDGPSLLLEVRMGDDLYQVAQWHCHRHSLGHDNVSGLSARLEQELPQHTGPDWADSRAEDRACSKSRLATTNTPGYPTFASNSSGPGIEAHPTKSNDSTATTAEGIAHVAPAKDESDGSSTTDVLSGDGSDSYCVTLAITTCKRLHGFMGTVEGLQGLLGPLPNVDEISDSANSKAREVQNTPRVCRVLVVDDGSSLEDRRAMMSAFPRFTYVFKGEGDAKGHAGSMNLILSLTKTRYLLYVEDDWWAAHDRPTPSPVGTENFLWRAMEVLRNSVERVSQVLINDQSSLRCSWGETGVPCTHGRHGSSRGSRFTSAPPPPQKHAAVPNTRETMPGRQSQDCSSVATSLRTHPDGGCLPGGVGNGRTVEFRLHEFGLMDPSLDLSNWPGFSLNPALWDLTRLGDSYRLEFDRQFRFDPTDIRFEKTLSMDLFDAGAVVAHLPDVTFRHVGAGQSAYVANDMHRPWD